MKALYHAWELGYDSWRDFAKSIIISNEVTIWGVSHDQIERANREYGFPYTPNQFATLVEEGIIKVAARTKWLMDPPYREELQRQGMELTRWVDSFDGRIRDAIKLNYVTALEPVNVDPWVETQRLNNTRNYTIAKEFIQNKRYDEQWYYNIAKRVNAELTEQSITDFLLRIARNHHIASDKLGCDTSIENWSSPYYLAEIGRNHDERQMEAITPSRNTKKLTIEDVLYNISRCSIHPSEDFKGHIDGIFSLKDSGVCQFLQNNRCAEIDIESDIIRKLEKKIAKSIKVNSTTIGGAQIVIDTLSYMGSIFIAANLIKDKAIARRDLIFGGIASAFAVTEIASKGPTLINHFRSDPPVHLSNVERASLILLKGKTFGDTVEASLAEEVLAAVKKFSHTKRQ